jgi:aconitate hydratase
MGQNIVEKILAGHKVYGNLVPGEEIGIRIDQTLTQDATGTMAYLQFEAMDVPRVKTELSVSYIDHNTIQIGFENADDHRYLQSVAQKFGVVLSRAGNGICHQVHLERFGKPAKTLIGSDSHTPTCGALGMIAIGCRAGYGRKTILSDLSQSYQNQPYQQTQAVGFSQRHHSQGIGNFYYQRKR